MVRYSILLAFLIVILTPDQTFGQLESDKIDIQNQVLGIKFVYDGNEYKRLPQMKGLLLGKGDPDVQRHYNRYKKNQILAPTFIGLGYVSFMFGVASAFSSSEGEGFVAGTMGGITLFIIGVGKIPKISYHARQAVAYYNSSKHPIMDNGKQISRLNNLATPVQFRLVSIPISH